MEQHTITITVKSGVDEYMFDFERSTTGSWAIELEMYDTGQLDEMLRNNTAIRAQATDLKWKVEIWRFTSDDLGMLFKFVIDHWADV